MMRKSVFSCVLSLAVVSMAVPVSTARGQHVVERKSYDGVRAISVTPANARQRLAVAQLGMRLAGEAERATGATAYLAEDTQIDTLRALGVRFDVLVDDVQKMIDDERTRIDARLRGPAGDAFYDEFRDITELRSRYDALEAAHPTLVSSSVIGQTIEGRDIRAFEITVPGGDPDRPALFYNGAAHAREWMSPMTVAYITERLAQGYGNDPAITALLDAVRVYVVPIANPDGYVYAWSPSGDRFWRKNRRNNGDGTFGVDWNRNFSVGYGIGSSASTFEDIYRGPQPFSEPETRAIRDYVESNPEIVAHIDFHSYSQLVLWPYGFDGLAVDPNDEANLIDLSLDMRDAILSEGGAPYTAIRAIDLYPAGGTSQDWVFGATGAYSWTIELRPDSPTNGGFAPPPSQIRPTVEENLNAVLALLGAIRDGIGVEYLGGTPDLLVAGESTIINIEIRSVFTDALDAGSAVLRVGMEGQSDLLVSLGTFDGLVYSGQIPALACGDSATLAVEVRDAAGTLFAQPGGAINVVAADVSTAFSDDMESDRGWTVGASGDDATTGLWVRMNPEGTAAQPEDDRTPSGTQCWITDGRAGTGLGSFDVDGGATTLTSPALDATDGTGEAVLVYARWYSNNAGSSPNSDSMPVEISGDGGATWTQLELVTENAGAWVERRFNIADFVTPSADVRVRFVARDLGSGSIVEAGVDDLRIDFVGCDDRNIADIAPAFGSLDVNDVIEFVQGFNAGDPIADVAPDFGSLDVNDVIEFVRAFNEAAP